MFFDDATSILACVVSALAGMMCGESDVGSRCCCCRCTAAEPPPSAVVVLAIYGTVAAAVLVWCSVKFFENKIFRPTVWTFFVQQ